MPDDRSERGGSRPIRRRDAEARPGHGFPCGPNEHAAAPGTGGEILQRLRLSGFAHGRDRRAVHDLRPRRPAGSGHARYYRSALTVGFGISTAEHVRAIGSLVEAVAVGSAFVRTVEQHADDPAPALEALARELASGLPSKGR